MVFEQGSNKHYSYEDTGSNKYPCSKGSKKKFQTRHSLSNFVNLKHSKAFTKNIAPRFPRVLWCGLPALHSAITHSVLPTASEESP